MKNLDTCEIKKYKRDIAIILHREQYKVNKGFIRTKHLSRQK